MPAPSPLSSTGAATRRLDALPEQRLLTRSFVPAPGRLTTRLFERDGVLLACWTVGIDEDAVLLRGRRRGRYEEQKGCQRQALYVRSESGGNGDHRGGPPSPFTVGPAGQAERIRESLSALFRRREELRLDRVVYYSWRDGAVYEGGRDFFGLHTGLLDIQGNPKPALKAYSDVTKKN